MALTTLGFHDVRTNAGTATQKLFGKRVFLVPLCQIFVHVYNTHSKFKAFFYHRIACEGAFISHFACIILHFYSTPLRYNPLVHAPGSKGEGFR